MSFAREEKKKITLLRAKEEIKQTYFQLCKYSYKVTSCVFQFLKGATKQHSLNSPLLHFTFCLQANCLKLLNHSAFIHSLSKMTKKYKEKNLKS